MNMSLLEVFNWLIEYRGELPWAILITSLLLYDIVIKGGNRSTLFYLIDLNKTHKITKVNDLIDKIKKVQESNFIDQSVKEIILTSYQEQLFQLETGFKKFSPEKVQELIKRIDGKINLKKLKKYQSYIDVNSLKVRYTLAEKAMDLFFMGITLLFLLLYLIAYAYVAINDGFKDYSIIGQITFVIAYAILACVILIISASFNWKRMDLNKLKKILNN